MNSEPGLRVAWLTSHINSGGVAIACLGAAEASARVNRWRSTVVALHDEAGEHRHSDGVHVVRLGLEKTNAAALGLLKWLRSNPQDVVISSDVPHAVAAYPHLPPECFHIVQVHDSMHRYKRVAWENHQWVDGILCVAQHIESSLRPRLRRCGFHGLLGSVHNGVAFPPQLPREEGGEAIRLLFVGRVDPLKGVLDILRILKLLKRQGVPVTLSAIGQRNPHVESRFQQHGVEDLVAWRGVVPHDECFSFAARCDLLMMLSHTEAFGLATVEAMAMGCVPIAYDIPSGSREIIEHARSGFLMPPGDFSKCVQLISSLQKDRTQLMAVAREAMTRARTEFNESVMAARLAQFVMKVRSSTSQRVSQRLPGEPRIATGKARPRKSPYQRVPAGLRLWLRYQACSHPRLSSWILRRWNQ